MKGKNSRCEMPCQSERGTRLGSKLTKDPQTAHRHCNYLPTSILIAVRLRVFKFLYPTTKTTRPFQLGAHHSTGSVESRRADSFGIASQFWIYATVTVPLTDLIGGLGSGRAHLGVANISCTESPRIAQCIFYHFL